MLPVKLQKWIDQKAVPQRLLLSGPRAFPIALETASLLQEKPATTIEKGGCGDVLLLQDHGKSLKIDFSDAAKRDDQGAFENVRGMVRWVSQKPVAPYRIVILENMERCSREAPQGLLKIIEEPPPQSLFLFTTENHYQILPTILSRMTACVLEKPDQIAEIPETQRLFWESFDLIQRFQFIDGLTQEAQKKKDRSTLLQFVRHGIEYAQSRPSHQAQLSDLLEAYQGLRANQNPKLVLERMVMQWGEEERIRN